MQRGATTGPRLRLIVLAAVVALAVGALASPSARAGTWTLDTCTLPGGQPASTDGWSSGWYGEGTGGSGDVDTCAQGGALSAVEQGYGIMDAGPEWVFTAPAGQTIAGGRIAAALTAPHGETWIATPQNTNQAADGVGYCALGPCGGASIGTLPIPHPGGTSLYAVARCIDSSGTCPASDGVNAAVSIHSAEIELADAALPTGSGFSGPLLTPRARGVADLLFTAADPNEPTAGATPGYGPGVYSVTVLVDGQTLYQGTPNTNGGQCVPVGPAPPDGGLMFDHAQPCQALESVDVPVDTRRVSDGSHDLRVVVTDAAGNSATVLDQQISTSNPVTTPVDRKRGEVHAQLVAGWHWNGRRTRLQTIAGRRLPRSGAIAVRCTGKRCPKLTLRRTATRNVRRLWRSLTGRVFSVGDRLLVTISAPRKRNERIAFVIRDNRLPLARLL